MSETKEALITREPIFEDTIPLMTSKDYKDRFKAEYLQLSIRMSKLDIMLMQYANGTLKFKPSCSYNLLYEQYVYMKGYMKVLKERAKIEKIWEEKGKTD